MKVSPLEDAAACASTDGKLLLLDGSIFIGFIIFHPQKRGLCRNHATVVFFVHATATIVWGTARG